MYQEKYNINWLTYSDHLRGMLHEMSKSDELTDVTLVCDDNTTFKAHKIVLSACSPVFKSIIHNFATQYNSVIYLRGIKYQEIKSILEFMYLGVAKFDQERMIEFLNVAKNLEIKDIDFCVESMNTNTTYLSDSENLVEHANNEQEQNAKTSSSLPDNRQSKSNSKFQKNAEGMFDCEQCQSQFNTRPGLILHTRSKHDGFKYACNQCDYQATQQSSLKSHIQSKHEGVKGMFDCEQCQSQFNSRPGLILHTTACFTKNAFF